MLSKSPFDANLTQLIFREIKKCSDETNRQSISFILHHPRCLSNESDCCGSPNQSCKASSYSSNVTQVTKDENLIIKGNNLLALASLKKKYANSVKCIYIDPPYYFIDNILTQSDAIFDAIILVDCKEMMEYGDCLHLHMQYIDRKTQGFTLSFKSGNDPPRTDRTTT